MTEPDADTRIIQVVLNRAAHRVQPPRGGANAAIVRGRQRRRVRVVGVTLAVFLMSAAILLPLLTLSGLREDGVIPSATPPSEEVTLDEGGVRLTVPEGWHARSDFLSGYTRKILQIATFPLPSLSDHEATSARSLIGADDVLIVIVEHQDPCTGGDPMFPRISPPLTIALEDFDSPHEVCDPPLPSLRDIPARHALARKTFELERRLFDLRVEFGTDPPPEQLVSEVNRILRSFEVGPYVELADGVCRKHELGFGDPDCPEPQWTKQVLEEAGLELASRDGNAFVARSEETEFFIWAEEVPEDAYRLTDLSFPERQRIGGVTVFGGDEEWRWRVQGLEVALAQGPDGDSVFPTIEQVAPLVLASIEVPYES